MLTGVGFTANHLMTLRLAEGQRAGGWHEIERSEQLRRASALLRGRSNRILSKARYLRARSEGIREQLFG